MPETTPKVTLPGSNKSFALKYLAVNVAAAVAAIVVVHVIEKKFGKDPEIADETPES